MNRFQEQQAEFLRTFGRVVYDKPRSTVATEELLTCAKLVEEEAFDEFVTDARKMANEEIPFNLETLSDHLLDTIYVACQAVNVLGVDLQPEFVKASDDLILEGK